MLAAANGLTVLALSWWLSSVRPAQIQFEQVWADVPFLDNFASLEREDPGSRVGYPDILSVSIAAGLIVSVILAFFVVLYAILLRITRNRKSTRDSTSASLASCALLIVTAFTLLTTFGSLLRQAVDWLFFLADSFSPFWLVSANVSTYPYAYVLPSQVGRSELSLPDTFPLLAGAGLIVVVVVLVASGWRNRRLNRRPSDRQPTRKRYFHDLVEGFRRRLLPAVIAAALIWGGILWAFMVISRGLAGGQSQPTTQPATIPVYLVLVILAGIAIANQSVRKTFDLIADIAGFWRPEWHPVCGASYRETVIQGIQSDVEQFGRVVLVGHSQGSVICHCYVARHSTNEQQIDLVTCGSPIVTIYQVVFPRHFSDSLLQSGLDRANSWANYWRETDPIASEIPFQTNGKRIVNQKLVDPYPGSPDGQTLGHSDYWKDPDQVGGINALVAKAPDLDGVSRH